MRAHPVKIIVLLLCIFVSNTSIAQRRANYLELGRIELSEGHYAKAIENLNIGLKLRPDSYEGYFLRAYAKFQLDDYTGAEEDCTHSIELYPYRSDVYCYRAITKDRLFDYNSALDDYEKAIALDSNNAEIYLNRSITYMALQQYELAIEDCNHAEKMHVRDENLYLIRGASKSKINQYKEAILDYNKAIELKPRNARAYVERGMARVGANDKDSAMMDFNMALSIDSMNTFGMFQKGLLEMDQEHYKQALMDLNRVIQLAPYSASAYFNRGILKSKTKDYYGALNDYARVLSISPDHVLTYYNRAGLEFEKGNLPDALNDYDKVIALYPDFIEAYRYRAEIKKAMNNLKGAAQDDKKANEIKKLQATASDSTKYYEGLKLMKLMTLADDFESPKDTKDKVQYKHTEIQPQPIFSVILFPSAGNKVMVYDATTKKHYAGADLTLFNKTDSMEGGMMKKRFEALDSAIYLAPGKASLYAERGVIFSVLYVYDRALSDFDKAIDLDPFNALSYFSRANTRLKLLELEASDNPQAVSMLNGFSRSLIAGNSYELAVKDYSSALALDTNFAYAMYNRATAKVAMNDFTGAMDDLTTAIEHDPTLAEAYFNKGLLLILTRENESACINLSKAGELGILDAYSVIKRYCDK